MLERLINMIFAVLIGVVFLVVLGKLWQIVKAAWGY